MTVMTKLLQNCCKSVHGALGALEGPRFQDRALAASHRPPLTPAMAPKRASSHAVKHKQVAMKALKQGAISKQAKVKQNKKAIKKPAAHEEAPVTRG